MSRGAVVRQAIDDDGAIITSVNLAEVLAKMDDLHPGFATGLPDVPNRTGSEAATTTFGQAVLPGVLIVEPFTEGDAVVSSTLRALSKTHGLSLGDRACLSLAKRLGLEVLTADRAWAVVADDAGVAVRVIR